jgi:NADH-quinone oxidoreductase subunit L
VYVVARNAVLFEHAPIVMAIVATIGALSAFFAATIGLVQNAIKRVLAYSTVSQLGYMFLATGVGAFAAGVFHLMTHAFFKALLFLGSGSVIHAMAGEQDMQKMGGLRAFMPVTFATMLVGTLAIAGIPPFSGFFSKDEIVFRTFLANRWLWGLAVATALMTAFYMFRLLSLTFFGSYRGRPWMAIASAAAAAEARSHGVAHPLDAHAHGQAQREEHEVTHGAADVLVAAHAWHGPHESPRTMTGPLVVLALGAALAGFAGVPAVLGGANAFERFLEPSFAARAATSTTEAAASRGAALPDHAAEPEAHGSGSIELALMLLSIAVAGAGILTARHLYLSRPDLPRRIADRWPRTYGLLLNKYYVDELYDRTAVRGLLSSSRGLWGFDRHVVDGAVNGSGWLTRIAAWVSSMIDKHVVDGAVNAVAWAAGAGSLLLRRLQTGLLQNYALLMVAGVFVLLSLYLLAP